MADVRRELQSLMTEDDAILANLECLHRLADNLAERLSGSTQCSGDVKDSICGLGWSLYYLKEGVWNHLDRFEAALRPLGRSPDTSTLGAPKEDIVALLDEAIRQTEQLSYQKLDNRELLHCLSSIRESVSKVCDMLTMRNTAEIRYCKAVLQ